MADRPLHFLLDLVSVRRMTWETACGLVVEEERVARDPGDKVTCGRCLRTRALRNELLIRAGLVDGGGDV